MDFPIRNAPPPDLAERLTKLGDPAGKDMRSIIEEVGLPQYCSMDPEHIMKNKPFILIWYTDVIFYPLLFGFDYVCIGYDNYLCEIMNSDGSLPPPSPRPQAE